MKRLTLTIALAAAGLWQATAQTEAYQVLVFRNTGEVNLLYAGEIDSITVSDTDAEGVAHGGPVCQVFHTADTAIVVPIAEIDSVAFGSRNEIELRGGVRDITRDSAWISHYDGSCIYYCADTPADSIPSVGQRLFYSEADGLFPFGLAAKVDDVAMVGGEYKVAVSNVELGEIFSKFFYAGKVGQEAPQAKPHGMGRAPVDAEAEIKAELTAKDIGTVGVKGSLTAKGDVVVAPLEDYYHVDLTTGLAYTFYTEIKPERLNGEFKRTGACLKRPILIPCGPASAILKLKLNGTWTAELKGEIKFNYEMGRKATSRITWTRQKGKSDDLKIDNSGEDDKNEAKAEVVLNGEMFLGVGPELDIGLIGSVAGAVGRAHIGPSVSGQLSLGTVRQLGKHNPELYAKATLEASLRAKASADLYNMAISWKDGKLKIDTVHHPLPVAADIKLARYKLELFPKFKGSKAVEFTDRKSTEVSMATTTATKIAVAKETWFEVADKAGNVVDSVYVGTIEAGTDSVQGMDTTIVYAAGELPPTEELTFRPMFHYMGYTVRAADAPLMDDMQLQPMVAAQTNGAVTYLSGYPFAGSARNDSTLYIAGPYLPVAAKDTVFAKPGPIAQGVYIGTDNSLEGTWAGSEYGTDVAYTFNADGSGAFSGGNGQRPFTYQTDTPQAGNILMTFDGGETKSLRVTFFSPSQMSCTVPPATEKFILNRQ